MTYRRDGAAAEDINNTLRGLGERLKNIREAQGFSLNEISEITKIQQRYLQGIEEGELSLLPKGPYVRGFIRQYCNFLSAPDLWNKYDLLTAASTLQSGAEPDNTKQDYISPKVFKATSYWWIYAVVIIALAVAGWITWSYRGEMTGISTSPINGGTAAASLDRQAAGEPASQDAAASQGAAASPDQSSGADLSWMDGQSAPKPAAAPQAVPPTVSSAQATDGKNVLRIVATGSCWTRVSSGEQILYSGTLRAGDSKTYTVTDRAIRVKYGNPSGVSVTWNGSALSPLGRGSKPMARIYRQDGTVTEE